MSSETNSVSNEQELLDTLLKRQQSVADAIAPLVQDDALYEKEQKNAFLYLEALMRQEPFRSDLRLEQYYKFIRPALGVAFLVDQSCGGGSDYSVGWFQQSVAGSIIPGLGCETDAVQEWSAWIAKFPFLETIQKWHGTLTSPYLSMQQRAIFYDVLHRLSTKDFAASLLGAAAAATAASRAGKGEAAAGIGAGVEGREAARGTGEQCGRERCVDIFARTFSRTAETASRVASVRSEIARLRTDAEALLKQLQEEQRVNEVMQRERAECDTARTTLTDQLATLQTQLQTLRTEQSQKRQEFDAAQQELNRCKQERSDDLASVQTRYDAAQSAATACETRESALQKRIADLEQELEPVRTRAQSLDAQLAERSSAESALRAQVGDFEARFQALQRESSACRAQNAVLTQERDAATRRADIATKQIESVRGGLEQALELSKLNEEERAETRRQVEEVRREKSELQAALEAAEQKIVESEQARAQAEAEKERAESEKARINAEKERIELEKARIEQASALESEQVKQQEKAQAEQQVAIAQQEKEAAEQEKEAAEQQAALAQQEKEAAEQQAALAQQEKEAAEQQAALAQQEKEAAEQQVAIAQQEKALAQQEKEAAEQQAALAQQEKEAVEQQAALAQAEKEQAEAQAALAAQEKALAEEKAEQSRKQAEERQAALEALESAKIKEAEDALARTAALEKELAQNERLRKRMLDTIVSRERSLSDCNEDKAKNERLRKQMLDTIVNRENQLSECNEENLRLSAEREENAQAMLAAEAASHNELLDRVVNMVAVADIDSDPERFDRIVNRFDEKDREEIRTRLAALRVRGIFPASPTTTRVLQLQEEVSRLKKDLADARADAKQAVDEREALSAELLTSTRAIVACEAEQRDLRIKNVADEAERAALSIEQERIRQQFQTLKEERDRLQMATDVKDRDIERFAARIRGLETAQLVGTEELQRCREARTADGEQLQQCRDARTAEGEQLQQCRDARSDLESEAMLDKENLAKCNQARGDLLTIVDNQETEIATFSARLRELQRLYDEATAKLAAMPQIDEADVAQLREREASLTRSMRERDRQWAELQEQIKTLLQDKDVSAKDKRRLDEQLRQQTARVVAVNKQLEESRNDVAAANKELVQMQLEQRNLRAFRTKCISDMENLKKDTESQILLIRVERDGLFDRLQQERTTLGKEQRENAALREKAQQCDEKYAKLEQFLTVAKQTIEELQNR